MSDFVESVVAEKLRVLTQGKENQCAYVALVLEHALVGYDYSCCPENFEDAVAVVENLELPSDGAYLVVMVNWDNVHAACYTVLPNGKVHTLQCWYPALVCRWTLDFGDLCSWLRTCAAKAAKAGPDRFEWSETEAVAFYGLTHKAPPKLLQRAMYKPHIMKMGVRVNRVQLQLNKKG